MKTLKHIELSEPAKQERNEALNACIEIFRRFGNEDIKTMGPTVRRAWLIGKKADGINK